MRLKIGELRDAYVELEAVSGALERQCLRLRSRLAVAVEALEKLKGSCDCEWAMKAKANRNGKHVAWCASVVARTALAKLKEAP